MSKALINKKVSFFGKIKNSFSKFRIFDVVVIFIFLNIVAVITISLYLQRISELTVPKITLPYLKITAVPDLLTTHDAINASAAAFVVYDMSSRSVVASKNSNLRFSPASTAKIMTATIVLEHYNLDQYFIVPPDINMVRGSKMNLVAGEEVSVRNLLYGMLLPSGNDAAYTLAYYYPGGVTGFVDAMNQKASELKLYNTHFVDPAGYEDGNFTTADELARLASYAMQNQTFREVVRTRFIKVFNRAQNHEFDLTNLNELLQYNNVIGVKTGFTNEAGGVLVTAVKKNKSTFIVVVLKSPNRFSDTQDLMKFIQSKVDFSFPKGI